ncbi:hypothetical protein HanRHA438_Chr03g0116211 [Helianthus annuus]|nr:hypothetical protein HanRHA438_Chr03g0116211 [Helianthus annuus]
MTHMVTRYALSAFGSVYVTSMHKLTKTGQTISLLSQILNVFNLPILYKSPNLSGLNHILFRSLLNHAFEPYLSLQLTGLSLG